MATTKGPGKSQTYDGENINADTYNTSHYPYHLQISPHLSSPTLCRERKGKAKPDGCNISLSLSLCRFCTPNCNCPCQMEYSDHRGPRCGREEGDDRRWRDRGEHHYPECTRKL